MDSGRVVSLPFSKQSKEVVNCSEESLLTKEMRRGCVPVCLA